MTLLWRNCAKSIRLLDLGRVLYQIQLRRNLADPGYYTKDKACHYCKELSHVKNDCPKLAQRHSKKMCEYPGCTRKEGYSTDKYWEDPKNEKDRPVNSVSHIKKNPSEASTVEIFP